LASEYTAALAMHPSLRFVVSALAVVGVSALALLAPASGCAPCPNSVDGVHESDRIQTTIVARETLTESGQATLADPSCGNLGDLVPGAVIISNAYLASAQDSCPFGVGISPASWSAATLGPAAAPYSTLVLPNGCTGLVQVALVPASGSSNVLDDTVNDAGEPSWWLLRDFFPDLDAGACPDAVPSGECQDLFIAKNVLLGQ
jgi:hypothetical protein